MSSSPPAPAPRTGPAQGRSTSYSLLLAVNVLLLAAVAWWIFHRAQSARDLPADGTGAPTAVQGTSAGPPRATPPAAGPPVIGPVVPQDPFGAGLDDPFAGRAGAAPGAPGTPGAGTSAGVAAGDAARRALAPRPAMDEATYAVWKGLQHALNALGPAIEVFRTVHGAHPASNRPEYGANRGIEVLVEALAARGALSGPGLVLGDTDGDGRKEIVDPWGRALVYFSHDDYASTQDVTGVGTVGARRRRVDDRLAWQAEERFQLFSVGPDGKDDLGGGDDVNSWVTR